ncbi:flagellar export protein FliJ [Desulfonatronovibrio hydrogenovorans]|uniref:flagellar export protein FliJ n=1 Tax=Desulfonatronovibrio hydrogenovorans TaxID=53245 RepID=UPI00048EA12B|nr:flagellar export protein FliJ [Desulfonatronovibrio hydrogenovorans]
MRKRFNFNLQKVLDYRMSLEEKAQLDLARSRKKYQGQVQVVDRINKELKLAKQELSKKENINQQSIWLWNKYIQRLNFDSRLADLRLKELAREVNARRQELLEKSRDKKILEKLKVNQKIKFEHEQEKAEQKEFDEMAVVRFKPETV